MRGLPADGVPSVISGPGDFFANFHSANAYTLYARFLPVRGGVELTGSNDAGRTWRVYDYRYLSQRVDRICPFFAPWYPRFEEGLEDVDPTLSLASKSKSALFRDLAAQLIAGNTEVSGLFPRDPFPERPPTMVRLRYYQLYFTDFAAYRQTGHFWRKEYKGDFLPMIYRNEHGQIVESNLADGDAALSAGNFAAARAIYEQQYQVGYPNAGFRLANLLTRGLPESKRIQGRRLRSTRTLPAAANSRP